MAYLNQLNEKINVFETHITSFFSSENQWESLINDAMLYSLNAGGKRLRPLLLLEVATAYGATYEQALPYAMALEMIHTYSLIHDDLPCMDDDDLRRGKPTSHKVFGEDIAVLAGDGLLNKAFEIMIEATLHNPDGIYAMQTIAKAAGAQGMILGQVADIKNVNGDSLTVEALDFINANKTGRLITAALVAGAQVAGRYEEVALMRAIGYKMGLMFQMKDDVLDITSNSAALGKNVNNDEKNQKCTYPKIIGIEGVETAIDTMRSKVMTQLGQLSVPQPFLEATVDFFVNRSF